MSSTTGWVSWQWHTLTRDSKDGATEQVPNVGDNHGNTDRYISNFRICIEHKNRLSFLAHNVKLIFELWC